MEIQYSSSGFLQELGSFDTPHRMAATQHTSMPRSSLFTIPDTPPSEHGSRRSTPVQIRAESPYTKLSEQQQQIVECLQGLQEDLKELKESHTSRTARGKKVKLDPQLSSRTRAIYIGVDYEPKFNPSIPFKAPENVYAKLQLAKAVRTTFTEADGITCTFGEDIIFHAVANLYANERQKWRLSQPGQEERKEELDKRRRNRSRRTRKLQKRGKYVMEAEKSFWSGVGEELMSDEEMCNEGQARGKWLTYQPSFRSEQLTQLCHNLDQRMKGPDMVYSASRVCSGKTADREKPYKHFKAEHIRMDDD